jgi:hypothetical protein
LMLWWEKITYGQIPLKILILVWMLHKWVHFNPQNILLEGWRCQRNGRKRCLTENFVKDVLVQCRDQEYKNWGSILHCNCCNVNALTASNSTRWVM